MLTEDDNNETDEWIYSYNIFMNTCQHVCDFNETTKMEENTSNGWIYGRFDHMENVQVGEIVDSVVVDKVVDSVVVGKVVDSVVVGKVVDSVVVGKAMLLYMSHDQ
jgi:hypothetical protein